LREATSKDCHQQFQLGGTPQIYKYQGANPLLKKQVCEMSMCASGIRDIAKVLKISAVTVIAILRLWFKSQPEPTFEGIFEEIIIDYASQMKCGAGLANVKKVKDGFGGRRCGMHNVRNQAKF
jgi:hypothetical protein